MRRQNTVRYLLLGGVVLAAVACGSYDHKEQYGKVQQRLECWGSGDCTWAEEGTYCVVPPSNGQLAYTLFCSSCKVVTAEAVGKYDKKDCKPDAGAGGTAAGGAAGSAGTSTGGAPTGGAGGTTQTCVPGQQISCGCGNFNGIQVCNAQGVYGLCDCDAGAGGASTGGTAGSAGSAGLAGAAGTTTGGAAGSGTGGTTTGGSAGTAGSAGQAGVAGSAGTSTGGTGGTSTGGSAGTAGSAGSAGLAGAAGTSTGGAAGTGGTSTGGSAGTAGSADAGTCNISNLPLSCTTVLGTACANKFEDAPNCNGLVRCGCTNMWVLTCAADNFTCSCHGGDLCSNWGWSEGYPCTELDPGGDGGTRTLTCQCNVMLDEPVVCVNPPDGGTAGTGGSSVGGSGGSATGGSAGAAGSATGGAGGTGGTSTGGSGGTATGGAGGSGGVLPDAGSSLKNPEFLTDSCVDADRATSPATLPAVGLWLQYQAPIKLPDTLLGEYDWTNYTTPGYTDTKWQIRTATSSTAATSIFTLLINTPGLSYDRWFMAKQIDPLSTQNCLFYNNDGYYCSYSPDAAQTGTLFCSGTWTLWLNNVQVATYTDAAGVTPALPFVKTFTFKDGNWAPKIGVRLPLSP